MEDYFIFLQVQAMFQRRSTAKYETYRGLFQLLQHAGEFLTDETLPSVSQHFSISSLMVRYTLAIRWKASGQGADMAVEEREVDIYHGAQLKE